MEEKILFLFLAVTSMLGLCQGSCFGTDAGWNVNAKPTVTQPSSNDPTKVMVAWGNIVKNIKCVDKFFIWVWPDGTLKTGSGARKIEVDKTKISAVVDIEPCIGYRFSMELEEDDLRTNYHWTQDVVFKTKGVASIAGQMVDQKLFTLGYRWDPVKHVSDLNFASIKFPKSVLKNANCIDYIQVTGSEVRGRPSVSRHSSTASMTGQVFWSHLGQSSSGYNPLITAGRGSSTVSTLPAGIGFNEARGMSPPRGPLARTYSSSSSSTSSSGSRTSLTSLPFGNSPFGPIEEPAYSNTLPRGSPGGATKQVGPVRVQPPFLNDTIELLITAPGCSEYKFDVVISIPQSQSGKSTQKKVSGLHLPALADIPNYIPPPVTEVMSITFGTSGKPIYGVKTSSGVSAACLPAYFEATDAYRQRLENEIGYFAGQSDNSNSQINQTGDRSDKLHEQTLKLHGCLCPSPNLEFTSTDPKIVKEHPEFFGTYSYKGMHDSHPSYEKKGTKTMYLFFHNKQGKWMFGPTIGADKGVEYGSVAFGTAKCPGDPAGVGNWMRKTAFLHRWMKNESLKVICKK